MSVAPMPLAGAAADRGFLSRLGFDRIATALVIIVVAVFAAAFQFRGTLAEYDLYWVLVGLLDGHATGLGTGATMHYGLPISFGYYELFDHLVPGRILGDPDRLIPVMNAVGLVSSVAGLVALALAVTSAYGTRVALVTVALFGLSPLYLDMALSGHPLLPALAATFAGAALLFAETVGPRRVVAWSFAALLLFAGLTIRAEVLIAFGWLVVARADTRSLRAFVTSAALRAVPPGVAVLAFFLAQRFYVDPEAGGSGTLAEFLKTFYDLRNIGKGVGFLAVGLGPALVVATAAALVWSLMQARHLPRPELARLLLGPLALMGPCLLLWLPNPSPSRHFTVLALGSALLIGRVVDRLRWSPPAVIAAIVLCIAGNEVVSEAARPLLLTRLNSPYVNFPERDRTLTQAPVGFAWRHHEAMQERHDAWTTQASLLAHTCDRRVIVLGDERFEMIAGLYRQGGAPTLSRTTVGGYGAITAIRPDGQRIDLIETYHDWPADAVARLLAAPDVAGAALMQVPWSRSVYDVTPVPADRLPVQDCRAAPELRGSL